MLDCAGKSLDLSRPVVMGVLNVTPDSFSDGGRFMAPDVALGHARRMVAEGAAIIDVGGESTRPGAAPVSEQEELRRVIPVIETIAAELPTVISIDTRKPAVMRAAVAAGAGMINDICALREEGALELAARLDVPVCLMHMRGEPRTMQVAPHYDDVALEIGDFLRERVAACVQAGIARRRLLIDPGFGFGKGLEHNLQLLNHLEDFNALELPIVVGVSRKSLIGAVLDVGPAERLYGSIALAAIAVWQGAAIIRAHDVAATAQAIRMTAAVRAAPRGEE
jgi:dihydropteroate synthase